MLVVARYNRQYLESMSMSVTIELPPETAEKLRFRVTAKGRDVTDFVLQAIEEKLQAIEPSFAEIVAPIHEGFRESGMSDQELDELLEQALTEVRAERAKSRQQKSE